MPVAERLPTLHVCDKSLDIPYDGGLLSCESEFRRQVEHCLFPFPVTRDISARGEPPRRSPQVYSMRGLRIYPLLAHCIGRYSGKVEGGRGVQGEGAPLSWRPSAVADAGNGAPLSTRCAPPSADAVAVGLTHRALQSTLRR